MTEVASGPRIELEPSLALASSAPLLVLVLLGLARGLRSTKGGESGVERLVTRFAWLGFVASGVALALCAFATPPGGLALHTLFPALRIGSLDVAFALELGRHNAAFAVLGAALFAFACAKSRASGLGRVAGLSLAGLALLSSVLADNLVYAVIGLFALELGRPWGDAQREPIAPVRFSFAALLAGSGVLFWSLGGNWSDGDRFLPELRARLDVVPSSDPSRAPMLSLTSLPGARVRLGGAELCAVSAAGTAGGVGAASAPCRKPAIAPFVGLPVRAGIHDLVVVAGPGTDVLSIDNLEIERPLEIVVTGPTLVFRELRRALEHRDAEGRRPYQRTFAASSLFGVAASTWVALLLGAALGARVGHWLAEVLRQGARRALDVFDVAALVAWLCLLGRLDVALEHDVAAGLIAACVVAAVTTLGSARRVRLAELVSTVGRAVRRFDSRAARWLALLALSALPVRAEAAAPEIALGPGRAGAPIELARKGSAYEATLLVENRGASRVSGLSLVLPAGPRANPETLPGLSAKFEGGATSIALEPGASRRILVRFEPPAGGHTREAYARLLVVQRSGSGERVLASAGLHVERDDGFWVRRGLSLCLLLPLAGAAAIGLARLLKYRRFFALRASVVAAAVAKLVLVVTLALGFDPETSRLDGNGGYQLAERVLVSRSLGLEYFVGVDGFGLAALIALALIGVAVALTALSVTRDVARFLALLLIIDFTATLAVVAVDSMLLLLALVGAGACKHAFARSAARNGGARGLGVVLVAALALVAVGFGLVLDGVSGYLLDGALREGPASIADLARAGSEAQPASRRQLGLVAIIGGVLLLSGAAPFQAVNLAFVRKARNHAASIAGVAGLNCALLHVLLRIGPGAMPHDLAALGPGLAWCGVAIVAYAAIAARGASDWLDLACYAAAAHVGLFLSAATANTAIGLQGAEALVFGGSLGVAGLFVVAGAIQSRLPSVPSPELRGLAAELPSLGFWSAGATCAAALGPISVALFAVVLAGVGLLPFRPAQAIAALLASALFGASVWRAWFSAFLGSFPDPQRKLVELEVHAGRLPALRKREWLTLAVLVLPSALLGVGPRPLFALTDTAAVDYAEPMNPPGPLQVSQTPQQRPRG